MTHQTGYDTDDGIVTAPLAKLFEHERPLHQVFGGGKVADVLLWRNKNVSAGLLLGITVIWFLFEVVEYNFVSLLCHIGITTMLVLFIWSTAADIFNWNRPKIPEKILQDSFFEDLAFIFHERFNWFLRKFLYLSCESELPRFLLVLVSLYILSVIGNYFGFVDLLYTGSLCVLILPFVYERYEEEIDSIVGHVMLELRKKYRRFERTYIKKIPRGPVKEKKNR